MKKSDIAVGGVYSDGTARLRKVVAEGADLKVYAWSENAGDNVRYVVIHDGTKKNKTAGEQRNITRSSFALWAKRRVDTNTNFDRLKNSTIADAARFLAESFCAGAMHMNREGTLRMIRGWLESEESQ